MENQTTTEQPGGAENMPQNQSPLRVELSGGKIARMIENPKGKHAIQAGRMANNDVSRVPAAMIAVLYVIDGKKMTVEDVEELPMGDYLTLATAVNEFGGN